MLKKGVTYFLNVPIYESQGINLSKKERKKDASKAHSERSCLLNNAIPARTAFNRKDHSTNI